MSFLLKKDDPNEVGHKNKDSGSTLAKESQENLQMLINYVRVDSEKEEVQTDSHLDKLVNGMIRKNDISKVSFFLYGSSNCEGVSRHVFFFERTVKIIFSLC